MIVFESDWQFFPYAIADTQTRNKSFLRIAALLRDMGVRHYYFPLALLQPELQGIDPYDEENLSLEQKARIIYECDNNPWYYLREVVIDPGAGLTIDECRYNANRGNIAAMWLLLSSIDHIRIQPRQTGKSFETYANTDWLLYFRYRDTSLNLITKDETLRKDSISKMKKIRDGWPEYLCRNTRSDDNNQISLSCKALNNKYYTHVGQKSEKAANNLGRGMTSPFLHFDEPPFIDHIETTIGAATGATNQARSIAERKNYPYCNIFTTTAGDKESRDGRFIYDLMCSGAIWNECFYDAQNREELKELIRTNSHSRAPLINMTLSHAQVGYSDEWLYDAIANARTKGHNIDRDYFNRWTASSSSSPIGEEDAKKIRASGMEPVNNWISSESYIFKWYQPIDEKVIYVITLDTSDAIGRDDIAVTMIDPRDGSVAGAGTYNETNLMRFAHWLCELMSTYPNTMLIPERRFNAQTIIDYLLIKLPQRGRDPFTCIYSAIVQEPEKYKEQYRHFSAGGVNRPRQVYDLYRKYFGFSTTSGSRDFLFSTVLQNAVNYCGDKVHDNTLISQLLNLTVKNGRIDHTSDSHDDMVISWLLGHWLLNYGVNLNHYGIQSQQIMNQQYMMQYEDPYTQKQKSDQQQLHREIEGIYEKLKSHETSEIEIHRLQEELRTKMAKVKDDTDEAMTLDGLLESAREARERNAYARTSSRNRHISALINRYGGR